MDDMWDYHYMIFSCLFFYMLWEYILAGIIQGQIIDAFAEIRLSDDELTRDEKDNCLCCSLSRFVLDSANIPFDFHVQNHHNPEHYLFYFLHLRQNLRSGNDFTGMESYVMNSLEQNKVDMMPMNTCAGLNPKPENEGETYVAKEDLMSKLKTKAGRRAPHAAGALSRA